MRWLLLLLSACATTAGGGVQGVTSSRGSSLEASVAGGAGFGDLDSIGFSKLQGGLGVAEGGGVQGRIEGVGDWFHIGDKLGWQGHIGVGGSFGAYQSGDLICEGGGGVHYIVSRANDNNGTRFISLALDAVIGYAFRPTDQDVAVIPWARDSAILGLGLSIRRDYVHAPPDFVKHPFD